MQSIAKKITSGKELQTQEWYSLLVEECKAIVVEAEFTSRWALVEGYHLLGERILKDNDNFERSNIYGKEIVQRVANSIGKSGRTVYLSIQFVKKYPDLQLLPEGKDTSWHQIVNKYLPSPEQDLEETLAEQLNPTGKYKTIIVDPPWPISFMPRDQRPLQVGVPYPLMNLEQIKELPINDISEADSHLYLWTTHKFLPECFEIVKNWGFQYQCLMTWVKNVGFTPFSWMYTTEHVLFCRKGNLPLLRKGLRLDFTGKVREHSRKPDEFYDLIKQASPEPRIDFFSREKRDGYEQWGNEINKFI
jgi:N6-adenosine-specific RNA methylase IME4